MSNEAKFLDPAAVRLLLPPENLRDGTPVRTQQLIHAPWNRPRYPQCAYHPLTDFSEQVGAFFG